MQMIHQGQLPHHLLKAKKPFCLGCQYGKMTKRLWQVKGDPKQQAKVATSPRHIVSINQLESATPRFITQLKATLMTQQYKYATNFQNCPMCTCSDASLVMRLSVPRRLLSDLHCKGEYGLPTIMLIMAILLIIASLTIVPKKGR